VDTINMAPAGSSGKAEGGRAAEKTNEPEAGAYVELTVKMPLTFYIQQAKQPDF